MTKSRMTGELRRLQIIEVAAEVFARNGLIGTRTRDIAVACGINEALLYKHFNNKEELYRQAMMHAFDEAAEKWVADVEKEENALEGLLALLRGQIVMLADNPVLCANMWHGVAATTHDRDLYNLVKDRFDRLHNMKKNLIEKGKMQGCIRESADPDTGAGLMRALTWSFIIKSLLSLQTSESAEDPETYCNLMREQLSS